MAEVTVLEGGAELLEPVRPLWLSMFEWHRSLPPEASAAVPALPATEALERRFERFARELGDGTVTLFLASEGEQRVGFAMVRHRPEGEASFATGAGVVEVDAMAVAPEHRDRGLGTTLFDHVHRWAADRGIPYVSLSVMAGNEEAERFYRRYGMERSVVRMLGPVVHPPSHGDRGTSSSRART